MFIPAGKYLYIEASGKTEGTAARLLSPVIDDTAGSCVQFWYHMYGTTTGNLTVSRDTLYGVFSGA